MDVLEHPQLRERDRWRTVGSPAGELRAILPPVTVAGREPRMDPIPQVGEHTEAVLARAGFEPDLVEKLREAGLFS